MLNFFVVLGLCATSTAFAQATLSGFIEDASSTPVEGAQVTIFDPTGKGVQTSSRMGNFRFMAVPEGDYFFKVDGANRRPVLGSVHLTNGIPHQITVVMQSGSFQTQGEVGAAAALRESVRPSRSSSKPPKVKSAQVVKKVMPLYPVAERKAGVHGPVRIAMIILPDGTLDDLVVLTAPDDNLAIAALAAVRQWRYSPTSLDGEPVEANLTVDVNFEP